MVDPKLYLIGTLHNDILYGKERLDALLNNLSPSIIALEMSKERDDIDKSIGSFEEYETMINLIIEESGLKLSPIQIETFIEPVKIRYANRAYELLSSQEYTDMHENSKLEYIDLSLFESRKEEFFNDSIKNFLTERFKQISLEPELFKQFCEKLDKGVDAYRENLKEKIQQMYQNAEEIGMFYEKTCNVEMSEKMKDLSLQEIQAFEQIYNPERDEMMAKRVGELYNENDIVVVIVGLAHLYGLKNTLKDLNPTVMTLADFDYIP